MPGSEHNPFLLRILKVDRDWTKHGESNFTVLRFVGTASKSTRLHKNIGSKMSAINKAAIAGSILNASLHLLRS
jgi:hypothetical protein